MSKAIGGYVRRCERRYVPPAPDVPMSGPNWMRYSVMPSGAVMCFRLEPPRREVPVLPSAFLPLEGADEFAMETLGQLMHSILGAPEQPGPPYVHTFVPPEPIGEDEDGNDIYPEPGPAYTLTESP